MQRVNSQDFRQHAQSNFPLAGQSHVDLGSAPIPAHAPPANTAGRALSAVTTAGSDVSATDTITQQKCLNIKGRFLLREMAKAEQHLEKLKGYWAAVAEDLGPTKWADPMNPYRWVWEQEISSACDKLEYLEQIDPTARVSPKSRPAHDFKARETNNVDNRGRNAKCDHAMAMCEKHASHMRTLKRKATRQRKKAREQMAICAQSHNFQRSGDFVSASDTSPSLGQRTIIETNQRWSETSRQDCAPFFEHQTGMQVTDAAAQAGAYHWHQPDASWRLSEINRADREESIEAIQDRILATLEKELTLPNEIPFLKALVPNPQVKNAETDDGDCNLENTSMVPPNLGNSGSISRMQSIKNVQGRILSALELTLPKESASPKKQLHEPKATRTVYVGGVPSLSIGDLQMLFHAYEM